MTKRKPEVRESRHEVTLRNLRAHAKRIAALERECKSLRIQLNRILFGGRLAK